MIATEGDGPSVLISLISLKNSERVVGSIIVGFAFTEEIMNEIRGGILPSIWQCFKGQN